MNIQQLIHYLYRPDADIFEASLLLAQHARPDLDIERYMHLLHAWSVELREQIEPEDDVKHRIAKLNRFLFREKGFKADHDDFYNPANSLMNEVIERRRGIPVSISILYATLGQRIGVDLQGISFPGHFLVKVAVEEGVFVLDPYHYGVSLSEEQLAHLLQHAAPGASAEMMMQFLNAATPEETIMRLLRSLKTVYTRQQDHEQTLDILNIMLLLDPSLVDERRERGLLLYQLECRNSALSDLDRYLRTRPKGDDLVKIQSIVETLKEEKATLH